MPRGPGEVARDNDMPFRCFMPREIKSIIRPEPARTTKIFFVRRGTTFHLLHFLRVRGRFLMHLEIVSGPTNEVARLARVRPWGVGICSGGNFALV